MQHTGTFKTDNLCTILWCCSVNISVKRWDPLRDIVEYDIDTWPASHITIVRLETFIGNRVQVKQTDLIIRF